MQFNMRLIPYHPYDSIRVLGLVAFKKRGSEIVGRSDRFRSVLYHNNRSRMDSFITLNSRERRNDMDGNIENTSDPKGLNF